MLDDTKLPSAFSHLQATDAIQDTCDKVTVNNLVSELPHRWRVFSYEKALAEQPHKEVAATPCVSVPFAHTDEFEAFIVGKSDGTFPKSPATLAVCLQFTQSKDNNMLETVVKALEPDNTWLLHITGPDSKRFDNAYGLDDHDAAQWERAWYFITHNIEKAASSSKTTLKIFTLTPAALAGAVGTRYGRFWHVQFYNWVAGDYVRVHDLPRNR